MGSVLFNTSARFSLRKVSVKLFEQLKMTSHTPSVTVSMPDMMKDGKVGARVENGDTDVGRTDSPNTSSTAVEEKNVGNNNKVLLNSTDEKKKDHDAKNGNLTGPGEQTRLGHSPSSSTSSKRKSEPDLYDRHLEGHSPKLLKSMNGVITGDQQHIYKIQSKTQDEMNKLLQIAIQSLRRDKVIAVPTDTIYGVACSAQSSQAINRLYEVKGRDSGKPVAICVGDVKDVQRWGKVIISDDLLSELLPGPVTVVLERTEQLNKCLNPGTSKVGIRVPDYGFVCQLAKAYGEAFALTSANTSSEPSSLTVQEFKHLWPHLDAIFDGGVLGATVESRQGSTVVDLSQPGTFTIIRPGSAHAKTVATLQKHNLVESKKS